MSKRMTKVGISRLASRMKENMKATLHYGMVCLRLVQEGGKRESLLRLGLPIPKDKEVSVPDFIHCVCFGQMMAWIFRGKKCNCTRSL